MTRAFIQSQPIDQRDKETGARKTIDARDNFERVLTHTMDRRCWAALMEQLGFDQLLDQQARKEFHDGLRDDPVPFTPDRSEEHTSELQSLMRFSYDVFSLKHKTHTKSFMTNTHPYSQHTNS